MCIDTGYAVWKIYLQPLGACQDEQFTFGLPLSFDFETQELAYKNAMEFIDPLVDRWLEDINEVLLKPTGEKV
jgi:hypothetical protein